ncbi:nucleoside-diphosphate sugar epimerase [Thermoclostridium stercorarium subsp. thermolacticum DSM 2910]|uniref:Nucleoside-diphosphate sugar epimerase n=1 Tax=Thermoclostridium stercorarium subsp. thermolacticum DSM 2910 TaxID=1121336 RepID=A0A1B1YA70_THEST|nr:nucleoside-diphosphate sugar epimerase/dehydratase [Thermoclostridium stercorarium]ANW97656.1 nucleoside-diphosphate sugar epimerase [Thermoclostridium stercorarium subsp. thermolacticum DSM 2910]
MRQKLKSGLFVLCDIILLTISFYCAYMIRFDLDFDTIPKYFVDRMLFLLAISVVLKIIVFIPFKLYRSLWKYAGVYELVSIFLASSITNGVLFVYIAFVERLAPRSIFVITGMLDVLLIGGSRMTYRLYRRLVLGRVIRLDDIKRVLIVGAGDAGAMIAKEMELHPEHKYRPVAFLDDDKFKQGKKINGIPVLGGIDDVVDIAERKHIDEIIIAIPSAKPAVINRIYEQCAKTKCKVKILPSMSQLIDGTVMLKRVRDVNIEDLLGREPVVVDLEEIAGYLSGKVVLVTGGGGSIGSELCRQIASFEPKRLVMLDNYENSLHDVYIELTRKYPELDIMPVIANIREMDRMEEVFDTFRPNIVFHAAAHKHVPLMEANPEEAIKNNVFGTWNVAHCADKYNAERFVLISTDKAVNPTNVMGATKRIAEMIIQALDTRSKTEFVAVRFGNVLGSNGSVIPLFKKQIEEGGPVTVTHPDVTRFFMTIPEAVQLVIQAGAMAEGGEIFILDMGEPVKILDLAKNMIRLSGFEPYKDIDIEITGLRPGEKLYEELLLNEEGLKATKHNKIYIAKPLHIDYELLKRELEILKQKVYKSPDANELKEYVKVLVPTYKMAQ